MTSAGVGKLTDDDDDDWNSFNPFVGDRVKHTELLERMAADADAFFSDDYNNDDDKEDEQSVNPEPHTDPCSHTTVNGLSDVEGLNNQRNEAIGHRKLGIENSSPQQHNHSGGTLTPDPFSKLVPGRGGPGEAHKTNKKPTLLNGTPRAPKTGDGKGKDGGKDSHCDTPMRHRRHSLSFVSEKLKPAGATVLRNERLGDKDDELLEPPVAEATSLGTITQNGPLVIRLPPCKDRLQASGRLVVPSHSSDHTDVEQQYLGEVKQCVIASGSSFPVATLTIWKSLVKTAGSEDPVLLWKTELEQCHVVTHFLIITPNREYENAVDVDASVSSLSNGVDVRGFSSRSPVPVTPCLDPFSHTQNFETARPDHSSFEGSGKVGDPTSNFPDVVLGTKSLPAQQCRSEQSLADPFLSENCLALTSGSLVFLVTVRSQQYGPDGPSAFLGSSSLYSAEDTSYVSIYDAASGVPFIRSCPLSGGMVSQVVPAFSHSGYRSCTHSTDVLSSVYQTDTVVAASFDESACPDDDMVLNWTSLGLLTCSGKLHIFELGNQFQCLGGPPGIQFAAATPFCRKSLDLSPLIHPPDAPVTILSLWLLQLCSSQVRVGVVFSSGVSYCYDENGIAHRIDALEYLDSDFSSYTDIWDTATPQRTPHAPGFATLSSLQREAWRAYHNQRAHGQENVPCASDLSELLVRCLQSSSLFDQFEPGSPKPDQTRLSIPGGLAEGIPCSNELSGHCSLETRCLASLGFSQRAQEQTRNLSLDHLLHQVQGSALLASPPEFCCWLQLLCIRTVELGRLSVLFKIIEALLDIIREENKQAALLEFLFPFDGAPSSNHQQDAEVSREKKEQKSLPRRDTWGNYNAAATSFCRKSSNNEPQTTLNGRVKNAHLHCAILGSLREWISLHRRDCSRSLRKKDPGFTIWTQSTVLHEMGLTAEDVFTRVIAKTVFPDWAYKKLVLSAAQQPQTSTISVASLEIAPQPLDGVASTVNSMDVGPGIGSELQDADVSMMPPNEHRDASRTTTASGSSNSSTGLRSSKAILKDSQAEVFVSRFFSICQDVLAYRTYLREARQGHGVCSPFVPCANNCKEAGEPVHFEPPSCPPTSNNQVYDYCQNIEAGRQQDTRNLFTDVF